MIYYHMLSPVKRIILKFDNEERCSNKEGSFSSIYSFLKVTKQISFGFVFLVLPPTTATEGNR